MRNRVPDFKDAKSLIDAAKSTIDYTLKLNITKESSSTILRNVYESFRMLGDALLVCRGIESQDHIMPIKELIKLNLNTSRSTMVVDNLRRTRHSVNYYGYIPSEDEAKEAVSIAKSLFYDLYDYIDEIITSSNTRK